MKTKVLAVFIALVFFGLIGAFIWAAFLPPERPQTLADSDAATASVSEQLSDGLLDMQVYALGGRAVRLEIQFTPNADASGAAGMRPDVNFAMLDMHMDGFDPPLQLVETGIWRASLKLPMAGRWVVSAGFGEDRAEVEFDAQ
jgi:hypothetical protein